MLSIHGIIFLNVLIMPGWIGEGLFENMTQIVEKKVLRK